MKQLNVWLLKALSVYLKVPTCQATFDAIKVYKENGIFYGPAKAANAGGVAVSALEMSQNSLRLSWTREEVDGASKTS